MILILTGISIILYPKVCEKIEEKNQTEIIKEYKENILKSDEENINKE